MTRPSKDYPYVSDGLLKHLTDKFPNKLPTAEQATEKELWLRIGEQRVVDRIKAIRRYHDKQDTKNNVHPITED